MILLRPEEPGMSKETMAERLARLEGQGLELTHRVANAIRAGSPERERILRDVTRLQALIDEVEALRSLRSEE
jgi:hypothetical protein